MSTLIIDIETGPLPDNTLLAMKPFLPDEVKVGNVKDPEKVKQKVKEAADGHLENLKRDAALHAWTGQVLAIGIIEDEGQPAVVAVSEDFNEKKLLETFWRMAIDEHNKPRRIVGWNIKAFDIPFLIRRSWANKVTVPTIFLPKDGRYWGSFIKDVRDTWACGEWKPDGTLGDAAQMLGVGKKTGSGADFATLFAMDRDAAIKYLKNDLILTKGVYDCLENAAY